MNGGGGDIYPILHLLLPMQIHQLAARALRGAAMPAGLALAGFGATYCHSRDEPLPDPCAKLAANPLIFQFVEAFGTPTPDTAYNNQPLAIKGPGAPYTSYQWLVGKIDERTGQNIVVSFDGATLGPIPVRLIAKRPPNPACFKNDDGVDTLTKVLTLVPYRDLRAPIYGKFQGANTDAPRDTFTVRIYSGPNFYYPNIPGAEPTNYVAGMPKWCQYPHHNVGLTWRGFTATNGTDCSNFDLKGYLTTRDSIRIEYRTQIVPTIIDKIFVGKRVH